MISKQSYVDLLGLSLQENIKALEYSKTVEDAVLSFTKIYPDIVIYRYYFKGIEVMRHLNGSYIVITKNLAFNGFNYKNFVTTNNDWKYGSPTYQQQGIGYVKLCIDDYQDKDYKYIIKENLKGLDVPFNSRLYDALLLHREVEMMSKFGNIDMLKYLLRHEAKLSKSDVMWCIENKLSYHQILAYETVMKKDVALIDKLGDSYRQYKQLSKYLSDDKIKCYKQLNSKNINLYIDFRTMQENLGLPTNKLTIYPKQIKRRHDELSTVVDENKQLYDENKTKRLNEEIQDRIKEIFSLQVENDNYKIVIPKTIDDFKHEASALKHCINSYIERYAKGETIILFVRKKGKEDKPLYTIELKQNRINQFYGKHNCKPPINIENEVKQMLNLF